MFYKKNKLRFQCVGCGACCVGDRHSFVGLDEVEAQRIQEFLGLSRAWFRRRYLLRLPTSGLGIRLNGDGRCPFLNTGGKCAVYTVRPRQCRTYPFWPEVVGSEAGWRREARRCEGIGQGPVVPIRKIEAALEQD